MSKLRLHLCRDCRPEAAHAAQEALQVALDSVLPGAVKVEASPCLECCDRPVALSIQRPGGAGYVFRDIRPDTDLADIVATCRAYLDSPDGWIEDARPCGRLRFCLAARLPA